MDLPESEAVSFIVKIQLERAGHESGSTIWHGYITHVPSGERRYLKDLNDIIAFIVPYLKQLGVNFSRFWPLRMSLYCWKFLLQKE